MPIQMSIREKRKLRNVLIAAFLFLAGWLLFSPWGYVKYYRINSELEEVRKANLDLEEKNIKLAEEVEKLTSDPAYIEQVARKELGMVKKNELVFDFSDKKKP